MAKSLTSDMRANPQPPLIWPAAFFVVALFLFRQFSLERLLLPWPAFYRPNGLHIFGKNILFRPAYGVEVYFCSERHNLGRARFSSQDVRL